MKKLLVIVLVAALVLSGCSFGGKYSRAFKEKEANYQQMAQEYMAAGDYDSAVAALEKGLREIDSDVLRQLLEEAKSKRGWRPTAQNTTPAQEEEDCSPEYEATEYQPPVQVIETTEATEPPRKAVQMTMDGQYEINVFLSNFSEQSNGDGWNVRAGETYRVSGGDVGYMARFIIRYYQINVTSQVDYENGKAVVKLKQLNKDMERFFGITVTESQLASSGLEVGNGKVYCSRDFVEGYDVLSVATEMYDNGDGTYTAVFEVYAPNSNFVGKMDRSIYELGAREIRNRNDLRYVSAGEAVVRPYSFNGRNSYQLVSYTLYG